MEYIETRVLTKEKLRDVCVANNWYTKGSNAEYASLLNSLFDDACGCYKNMTVDMLAAVALDIFEHSEINGRYTMTSVMSELTRVCVSLFDRSEECSESGPNDSTTENDPADGATTEPIRRTIQPGDFEIESGAIFWMEDAMAEGEDGYCILLTACRNVDDVFGTGAETAENNGCLKLYIGVSNDFSMINPAMDVISKSENSCKVTTRTLTEYEQAVLLNLAQRAKIRELQQEAAKTKTEIQRLKPDCAEKPEYQAIGYDVIDGEVIVEDESDVFGSLLEAVKYMQDHNYDVVINIKTEEIVEGCTFQAVAYSKEDGTVESTADYDNLQEAVDFVREHKWDKVINPETGRIYYKS